MIPPPSLQASSLFWHSLVLLFSAFVISAPAAVPQLINHQGRIAVNGTNFEGAGQFKFALINTTGSTTYWSNDNTSTAGSEPTAAVSLTVVKGLYAVLLGDAGMTALPTTVFENADVRLRVWFNDGTLGFQQITPDQRLASAPFSLNSAKAESVPDGSITSAKLASDLTLAGTTSGTFNGNLTGSAATALNATNFTGLLAGDVTGTQSSTSIADATVTGKAITGFFSGAGTVTASDSILTAINKLNGNLALKAPLASPTFTGTVTGTFSGNGSALTNLSGGNLTAGSVALSALAGNSVDSSKIVNSTIVNADVSGSAAIAYGKLNLACNIVNADISGSAAIADTKLATISSTGKVANSATTGTALNTPSTLVLRDVSGNFSAGTITGTSVGDGSGLTGVNASQILLENVIAPPHSPCRRLGGQ